MATRPRSTGKDSECAELTPPEFFGPLSSRYAGSSTALRSSVARGDVGARVIDTFRNRAILPIRSTDGTIIAFIGRAADHAAPGTPKYLNSCGLKGCTARARSRPRLFLICKSCAICIAISLISLLKVAGLLSTFQADLRSDPDFEVNWTVVKDWDSAKRYEGSR